MGGSELRRGNEQPGLADAGSPSRVNAVSRPALAETSSCRIAPSSTCLRTTGPVARRTWIGSGDTAAYVSTLALIASNYREPTTTMPESR